MPESSNESTSEPNGPLVKFAFLLLGITAVGAVAFYVLALFMGLIVAFPFGLLGLIPLLAVCILIFVVLKNQASNKEDQYYSKNVDQ